MVGPPCDRHRTIPGGLGTRDAGQVRGRGHCWTGGDSPARPPGRSHARLDGRRAGGTAPYRRNHGDPTTLAGRLMVASIVQGIDIVHHIGNSHSIELPFLGEVELPRFPPIHIGGLTLDLSPTKHLVYMLLAATIVTLVFVLSARAIAAAEAKGKPPKGFAGAMEAMALYIRQEVVLPNVGPHGEGYAPYLLTLFFFILTMNLLGLLPWGATATGNISVTAALAVIAFIVVEVTGMR